MTLFGKLVFGLMALILSLGVYSGVQTYANKDVALSQPQDPSLVTGSSTDSTDTSSLLDISATTTTDGKKIPFNKLIAQGGSQQCAVTQTIASVTSTGTVFIHDDHLKADFSMTISGQRLTTAVLIKDGFVYTWTNNPKIPGNKVAINDQATTGTTSVDYVWNADQIGDYECSPWTVDDTVFDVPKSVTFTTVN